MENLHSYLADKRKGDFAKSVGIAPAYLSQILSGHRRPSFDLMCRIDRATSGSVPVASWIEKKGIKQSPKQSISENAEAS